MRVPFGNLKDHYRAYKNEIDGAIQRVLDSGHFILGPELERLEQEFAEFLGVKYVVGCASGTEAIYLALAAVGVDAGDEVLVVAHTAVPTISAISMTRATPVFVDIDEQTCLMDASKLESKITARTKAIVPVHLYGQMVDMEAVLKLAAKHKLYVMEDVAQATGAMYNDVQAGALGDLGAFSFYPSKNLGAFGDGGAVSTNSKTHFERLLMLRNYGQSKRYHHDMIGINSRLDEVQAAILAAQIPFVCQWNDRRFDIANRYNDGLKHLVQIPSVRKRNEHVYHLYVIQVDERDQLQAHLTEKGVQTLIHYPIPAHLQKAYQYLGYRPGDLPVTERVTSRILSLPMYPELSDAQVDEVIHAIHSFYQERNSLSLTGALQESAGSDIHNSGRGAPCAPTNSPAPAGSDTQNSGRGAPCAPTNSPAPAGSDTQNSGRGAPCAPTNSPAPALEKTVSSGQALN